MVIEDHAYSRMVYNSLRQDFNIDHIIIDNGQGYFKLIKRRIKKLGLLPVIGQVLFRLFLVPYISYSAKDRIKAILKAGYFSDTRPDISIISRVKSINTSEGHYLLKKLNPDIVVVVTHRVLSKKTLELTNAIFINIHAGITPLYRGLHGGYWALINNDKKNCGVTVHILDEGIDTGGIIYQDTITDLITKKDNYISYIYLQLFKAIPLLKRAIKDQQMGNLEIQKPQSDKKNELYYQPTIWFYLYNWWVNKIK